MPRIRPSHQTHSRRNTIRPCIGWAFCRGDFQIMSARPWRHSTLPTSSPGDGSTRCERSRRGRSRAQFRRRCDRNSATIRIVRHLAGRRPNRDRALEPTGPHLPPPRSHEIASGRVNLHRGIRSGGSRNPGWPPSHNTLALHRELQDRYPNVRVEEDRIFTHDGRVWTSAGMTAGIDLALALVESDLGVDIARQVAKGLVMYLRRGGAQGQESALLSMAAQSDRIQTALSYARQNLRSELSVEELAAAAHLSVRQFSRAFRQETG